MTLYELSLFSVDMSALCIIAHIACIIQYFLKMQCCSCTSMHNVVLLFYSCNTLGFDVACETFRPIISMTFAKIACTRPLVHVLRACNLIGLNVYRIIDYL